MANNDSASHRKPFRSRVYLSANTRIVSSLSCHYRALSPCGGHSREKQRATQSLYLQLVGTAGLEPARIAPTDFKSGASTDFATSPRAVASLFGRNNLSLQEYVYGPSSPSALWGNAGFRASVPCRVNVSIGSPAVRYQKRAVQIFRVVDRNPK
jgi:hypothetical protein